MLGLIWQISVCPALLRLRDLFVDQRKPDATLAMTGIALIELN